MIPNGYVRTEDLVIGDEVARLGGWHRITSLARGEAGYFAVGLDAETSTHLSDRLWRLRPGTHIEFG